MKQKKWEESLKTKMRNERRDEREAKVTAMMERRKKKRERLCWMVEVV